MGNWIAADVFCMYEMRAKKMLLNEFLQAKIKSFEKKKQSRLDLSVLNIHGHGPWARGGGVPEYEKVKSKKRPSKYVIWKAGGKKGTFSCFGIYSWFHGRRGVFGYNLSHPTLNPPPPPYAHVWCSINKNACIKWIFANREGYVRTEKKKHRRGVKIEWKKANA